MNSSGKRGYQKPKESATEKVRAETNLLAPFL